MSDIQLVRDGQEDADRADCDRTRARSVWSYFTCQHCRRRCRRHYGRGYNTARPNCGRADCATAAMQAPIRYALAQALDEGRHDVAAWLASVLNDDAIVSGTFSLTVAAPTPAQAAADLDVMTAAASMPAGPTVRDVLDDWREPTEAEQATREAARVAAFAEAARQAEREHAAERAERDRAAAESDRIAQAARLAASREHRPHSPEWMDAVRRGIAEATGVNAPGATTPPRGTDRQ